MKVKPSARVNKRYLLISGERKEIEKIILDYIGILGWAKATPVFVGGEGGKVILSVNRKEIDKVRGAFELADTEHKSNDSFVSVSQSPRKKRGLCDGKTRILKVSGTLKGLGKI